MKKNIRIIKRHLYEHIEVLTKTIGERNSIKYAALEQTYNYILRIMRQSLFRIKEYDYYYNNLIFRNIVAEKIGMRYPHEIIIIGAHYDTVHNSPGADDNSSGIAALLEFIRLFDDYENQRTMRFIAFTLEEPPFHDTPKMGSYVYAHSCKRRQENILFMISLEMLAYFSNKRGSQKYPHPNMINKYPNKGNFITIVGNNKSLAITQKLTDILNRHGSVHAYPIIATPEISGANLSDHSPFWNLGYKAMMITDTAFYRNPNYHEPNDTIDTLNFKHFSKLVFGLYQSLMQLDKEGTL